MKKYLIAFLLRSDDHFFLEKKNTELASFLNTDILFQFNQQTSHIARSQLRKSIVFIAIRTLSRYSCVGAAQFIFCIISYKHVAPSALLPSSIIITRFEFINSANMLNNNSLPLHLQHAKTRYLYRRSPRG